MPTKLDYLIAGSGSGLPTLDDLIAMSKALTGRDPTPEELAEAKSLLDSAAQKAAARARSSAKATGRRILE